MDPGAVLQMRSVTADCADYLITCHKDVNTAGLHRKGMASSAQTAVQLKHPPFHLAFPTFLLLVIVRVGKRPYPSSTHQSMHCI